LTSATHAYLPLYSSYPESIHAQLVTALETVQGVFGKTPKGFWLPEMGYFPGVESYLKDIGINYFFYGYPWNPFHEGASQIRGLRSRRMPKRSVCFW